MLSDDGVGGGGHADQFAKYIYAVMYEKTLEHELRAGFARQGQVVCTPLYRAGTVAAVIDYSFGRHTLARAESDEYIELVRYLFRRASGEVQQLVAPTLD